MMRRCVWVWSVGVLSLLGCVRQHELAPEIVVTTSILGDAVRTIVGNDLPVRVLMGPGVDPHVYKPTVQDLRALQHAACIVAHGLRLEGKAEDVLRSVARQKPVIFAAELLPAEQLRRVGPQQYDPHVWFDIRLWRLVVLRVADTLAMLFPPMGMAWRERARRYAERLDTLDVWVRQQIAQIPPEHRVLVSVHDAFSYLGRAYGLQTVALQGISTAAEFGLNDMVRVAELIVQRRLPAVFTESTTPARLMENVVQMARLRGAPVRIAGELYADALGAAGSGAETYEGMVRRNVELLVRGLAGVTQP
jgi:manganese/zinc/iron transport system substrate-binding protein